jgi:hypothetical protein
VVEENDCEHEGLRRDIERMALEPGRMAVILVAMVPGKVGGKKESQSCASEQRNKI